MNLTRATLTIGACILTGLLVAGIGGRVAQTSAEAAGTATTTCALTWSTGTDPAKSTSAPAATLPRATVINGKGYINAPAVTLPAHKTCTGGSPMEATWTATIGTTHIDDIWFLDESQATEYILDAGPLGVRTWTGHLEPDATETDVAFVDPAPIDFRLAATGKISSFAFSANCASITFKVVSTRYAAKWNGYVANTSAKGSVQWRPVDSATWQNVSTFTTDTAGAATVTRTFPGLGDYRVWIDDAATIWAASSSPKYIEETC